MKLYGSVTSPYVRKVRALALEKGLALTFEPVTVIADPQGAPRRLNPLGKVPVLACDDGEVLYDSPVIAEYLDSLGEPRLLPGPSPERWAVLRLCALADGLCDAVVARMMELRRPDVQRSSAVIAREEERVARVIAALTDAVGRAALAPGALPRPLVGAGFTVGASAPIFGLFGALIEYGNRSGQRGMRRMVWGWVVAGAIFGLAIPGIDNWAHAGGFVGGWLAAKALGPLAEEKPSHVLGALVCLVATAASIALSIVTGLEIVGR